MLVTKYAREVVATSSREQAIDGLLARTEARRGAVTASLEPVEQRRLGQYFTPQAVAERIAGEPSLPVEGTVNVLDPGAGCGSLLAAFVARVLRERRTVNIKATAVEIAPGCVRPLQQTLDDCEEVARTVGGRFEYEIVTDDFVSWAAERVTGTLGLTGELPRFNIVIQNPPLWEGRS
jgi:adenine-specific DNA-methyltransferase